MKVANEDRRSKRTRQLLGRALIDLMLEKPFDDITVQDILDRADVGRSTFYAHYTDKQNLMISEIGRVIHQLDTYTAELGHIGGRLLPSLELFRHIQQQRRLMQAFVWGRGAEALARDFRGQVSKTVEQNLSWLTEDRFIGPVPLPVIAAFVASTFLMLLLWWFEEDMRQTPEQMDEIFQRLIMPSVRDLIGPSEIQGPVKP